MSYRCFITLVCVIFALGCAEKSEVETEISKINVNLKISRFDLEIGAIAPTEIPKLREKYPYLFPAPDSVWVNKLQDTLQIELLKEVKNEFLNFEPEAEDLTNLFKHLAYYFPKIKIPHVITTTSDVEYNNRVILADSILLIGLDNYLGENHKFYQGFQKYISFNLDKKFLVSDVAEAYAKKIVPIPKERDFLSSLIYYGKILFLKDKIIPFVSDDVKIGYSEEELAWVELNEEPMWRYFIERELLYSTDNKLDRRFLEVAPFSKFGLELDNESPGRVGQYIGWQIVRQFSQKNSITLNQLLNLSAEDIFKNSNYKPKN